MDPFLLYINSAFSLFLPQLELEWMNIFIGGFLHKLGLTVPINRPVAQGIFLVYFS